MRNAIIAVLFIFALTACSEAVKSGDTIRWQTISEKPGEFTVAIDKDNKQGCRALGCIASDYEGKVLVNISGNKESGTASSYSYIYSASVACQCNKNRTLWGDQLVSIDHEQRAFSPADEKRIFSQSPEIREAAHMALVQYVCKDVKPLPISDTSSSCNNGDTSSELVKKL